MPLPRLRQVALVAAELAPVSERLRADLGLDQPYADPGVGEFGLENAVFAVGDTFLEVVAPVREGTTAGRYLAKRGSDGGYMAIFQVADIDEARKRVADLGARVVWQADLDDIAGTHLHPRDVPGAIVSLDWADPPGSWRWAGPAWTGAEPVREGGITAIAVETPEPERLARRWAEVLGVTAAGAHVDLDGGRQRVSFVPSDGGEGIVAVEASLPGAARGCVVGSAAIRVNG